MTALTLRAARRLATASIVGLGVLGGGFAAQAETIKLTATAGHPPVFLWVKLMSKFFIPEIDKRLAAMGGQYKIEWTEAYGGTVAKIGGELDAIKEGISDIGFVGTIFEASKMPLQNVSYFVPFTTDDVALVTRTIGELQKSIPAMGAAWTRNNQVYLGGAALDTYQLFTNFPVKSIDDLKGRKIMAPGPSANWIKGTGAVAVAASLPQYYNNIKTGVAEGVLTFATGAMPIKLVEVAPYITKVNIGSQFAGGISINKDRWDSFPPEVQKVFREVAAEYGKRFAAEQTAKASLYMSKMEKEMGAKVSELSPAERKRWADTIPNAAKLWAKKLEKAGLPGKAVLAGYMKAMRDAGVDLPRDWSRE